MNNMKVSKPLLLGLGSICAVLSLEGQGTFVNLDFEAANVSGYPAGTVPANEAIPGWTAYIANVPQSTILYNYETLGEAAISLQGQPGGIYPPIQGQYFVFLQATFFAPGTNAAAIGQTGTIPSTAQSLVFWGDTSLSGVANNMQVTFNGESVPYAAIGSGSTYTIYGADISGLEGQTGQLLFTAYNNTYAAIDNIQFSDQPIPEPGAFALCAMGALLAGWRVVRRRG
jgi:hypothetical protein